MNQLARLFGKRVKDLRKAKGISQEAFAQLCAFDRSYMSRIERGIVRITLEKVYVIARILECQPADLLPDANTPNLLDP